MHYCAHVQHFFRAITSSSTDITMAIRMHMYVGILMLYLLVHYRLRLVNGCYGYHQDHCRYI